MYIYVCVSERGREKRRRYPCGGMTADPEGCTRSWQILICDEVLDFADVPCETGLWRASEGVWREGETYMLCIVTLSIVGDDAKDS